MSLIKGSPGVLEAALSRYEKSSGLRALVQLVLGFGGSVDTLLVTYLDNIRIRRISTFFEELDKCGLQLSEEQLKNEDLLHAFMISLKAAINARRGDKIRLFARLLSNYARGQMMDDIDEFEESLQVLEDISVREFQVLLILRDFERKPWRKEEQNDLQWCSTFWSEFLKAVEQRIGVPKDELPGFLTRLNRTGLYKTFTGSNWGYGGDRGCTTSNFERLLSAVSQFGGDDYLPMGELADEKL
ncbi:MAG TPA: hypothetical protein GXX51_05565 [Firmicutes bacterium]|nr:hypothetical protein [Bacillota bacterium]